MMVGVVLSVNSQLETVEIRWGKECRSGWPVDIADCLKDVS